MKLTTLLPLAALVLLGLDARPVQAQAWPIRHQWRDKARPGDPTSGSFAYEFAGEAVAAAGSMTAAGDAVKYDCADLAITLLCNYAGRHGLPLTLKADAEASIDCQQPRFRSPAAFAQYARGNLNASMVARLNTQPIPYAEARGGDLFLMKWSQLGALDPFPGRDVWHTYVIGEPEKLLFYGNDDSTGAPYPITATGERRRLDDVHGPAVWQALPRRWNVLVGNVVPPERPLTESFSALAPREATVAATLLNVRAAPSTTGAVVRQVPRGTKLAVEGVAPGGWLRVRLASGDAAYVKDTFAPHVATNPRYSISGVEPPVTGITGIVGNPGP